MRFAGVDVIESRFVPPPREPTPGEWARRYVRHGLKDVLEWLGEDVGPAPGDLVHVAFMLGVDPALQSSIAMVRGEIVASMRLGEPRQFMKIVMV